MLSDLLEALKKAIQAKDEKAEEVALKNLEKVGVDKMTAYIMVKEHNR